MANPKIYSKSPTEWLALVNQLVAIEMHRFTIRMYQIKQVWYSHISLQYYWTCLCCSLSLWGPVGRLILERFCNGQGVYDVVSPMHSYDCMSPVDVTLNLLRAKQNINEACRTSWVGWYHQRFYGISCRQEIVTSNQTVDGESSVGFEHILWLFRGQSLSFNVLLL